MATQGYAAPIGGSDAGSNPSSTDQAAQKATEAKEQVKQQAGEKAEQLKGGLRGQVDQRSTQAGEQVRQQASDVRTVAEQLREQGKEGPAKVAEQAADRAERLGGYLQESDADRIIGDLERYARSNPWAVVAGGLAAGFVASRMLRASSQNRSGGTSGSGTYADTGDYAQLPPAGRTTPATPAAAGTTDPLDDPVVGTGAPGAFTPPPTPGVR